MKCFISISVKTLFCFSFASLSVLADIKLSDNGNAYLPIIIPDEPTHCEKYSAELLKKYLDKVTSAKFEIISETKLEEDAKAIFVGNTKKSQQSIPDYDAKKAPFDSIRIKSDDKNIFIKGHSRRGTLYAVSTFLEDCIGVKAWAEDDIFTPKNPSLKIPTTDISYAPRFTSRKTDVISSRNE